MAVASEYLSLTYISLIPLVQLSYYALRRRCHPFTAGNHMAFKFNVESEHLPVNRSAAFYRKIVNGIQDLVLVLAQDGRILFASSVCQSLTAFPPKALVGNLVTSFMHHDDLPIFLAEFKNCFTAGESWTFHHRIRRQDDSFAVFESAFKPYHDTEISKSAGLTGIQLCLMTARPYSTPCTTKMDTFLE